MPDAVEVLLAGDSMWPTFLNGDRLMFDLDVDPASVMPGDVVLVSHPLKSDVTMVKRVRSINEHGRFFVVGDHPDPTSSEDSHNFGYVATKAIVGRWNGDVKRA